MHILFLTDNFPPEGNAPATRTFEHVREWVKLNHKVTVITCAPNFPEGKVFDGYQNKWFDKSSVEGIDVIRVKTYITANEGFIKRTLDFVSFMVTSFFAGLFIKKADVVIGTSPQFFTVISAWALSAIKRVPFVFELRDIWPASITAVGAMKKNWVIKLLERIEMFLYSRADLIISVTNSFKDELITRGVEGSKISVVVNGVDLTSYTSEKRCTQDIFKADNLHDKFIVAYLGTHGLAHALEHIVDAAEILKDIPDILFMFAGGGADKARIEQIISEKQLSNVMSLPRQDKKDMNTLWSYCDLSVVSLKNTALFKTVIPSKIFEAMGTGTPILASIPDGEATEIIKSNGCGLTVPPESPEAFASAVKKIFNDKALYAEFRENAQKSAVKFERQALALKMLQHVESLK